MPTSEPDHDRPDDPRLRRPLPPSESKSAGSPWSIVLALGATALICVALFFLTGGFFAIVMVVGGLAFFFAALHYLVWGWWLGKFIEHEVAEEEEDERNRQ